jgi:hypothetical protein
VTYVAIRGTEIGLFSQRGILDMLRNLRFLPWHHKATGWGHAGYIRGAIAVADLLAKLIPPHHRIVMTGHSLGAAIAVLTSQLLHAQGRSIHEVVMFGSPRIYPFGRPVFAYPVTSYRHGADAICLVPRLYWHAVQLTIINPRKGIPCVDDHGIHLYEKALKPPAD